MTLNLTYIFFRHAGAHATVTQPTRRSTPERGGERTLQQQMLSPIVGEHVVDVVAGPSNATNQGQILFPLPLEAAEEGQRDQGDEVQEQPGDIETDSNPDNPELALTKFLYDLNNGKITDVKGTTNITWVYILQYRTLSTSSQSNSNTLTTCC